MLRVDSGWNVVWNDSAPSTCTHDRYDHVAWKYGVALQLLIFFRCDKAALVPYKLIVDSVIYAEYRDASVREFGMEELAAKRAGAYRIPFICGELTDGGYRKAVAKFTKKVQE